MVVQLEVLSLPPLPRTQTLERKKKKKKHKKENNSQSCAQTSMHYASPPMSSKLRSGTKEKPNTVTPHRDTAQNHPMDFYSNLCTRFLLSDK